MIDLWENSWKFWLKKQKIDQKQLSWSFNLRELEFIIHIKVAF